MATEVKKEIDITQVSFSPEKITSIKDPELGKRISVEDSPNRSNVSSRVPRNSVSFSRIASVTGQLEVRLMGCQDLLEDVPGRSKMTGSGAGTSSSVMISTPGGSSTGGGGGVFSSPSDFKSVFKGVTRSSSKSYNIKDDTSSKYFKILYKGASKNYPIPYRPPKMDFTFNSSLTSQTLIVRPLKCAL